MNAYITKLPYFLVWMSILTSRTTTTLGCNCVVFPTLDIMLQDNTTFIFRGIVLPRFLSSIKNNNNTFDMTTGSPSTKYFVRIQRVYRNGINSTTMSDAAAVTGGTKEKATDRSTTITIVSPKNSCGISILPIFRTFLFTGVISVSVSSQRRSLLLLPNLDQQPQAQYHTDTTDESVRKRHMLRRRSTSVIGSIIFGNNNMPMMMNVDLCGSFIQLWRTVSPTERKMLSNLS